MLRRCASCHSEFQGVICPECKTPVALVEPPYRSDAAEPEPEQEADHTGEAGRADAAREFASETPREEADPIPLAPVLRPEFPGGEETGRTQFEEPPPPPRPDPEPPPPSAADDNTETALSEVRTLMAAGYGVYLMVGVPHSGKTQHLLALQRRTTATEGVAFDMRKPSGEVRDGRALPTAPNVLDCLEISGRGRERAMFVDLSGEHYNSILPELSQSGQVYDADISFLKAMARSTRGLVHLIDLPSLWNKPGGSDPASKQVEIALWTLDLMRVLRSDLDLEAPGLSALTLRRRIEHLAAQAPPLDIPVLVLFSKADQALGCDVPLLGEASGRELYPYGESPFFFAMHALPELHGPLLRHVKHFRYDFSHSLQRDEYGAESDRTPSGVLLSTEWLLDRRWGWPSLTTRHWVWLQRAWDRLRGRGGRWRALPDPEEGA